MPEWNKESIGRERKEPISNSAHYVPVLYAQRTSHTFLFGNLFDCAMGFLFFFAVIEFLYSSFSSYFFFHFLFFLDLIGFFQNPIGSRIIKIELNFRKRFIQATFLMYFISFPFRNWFVDVFLFGPNANLGIQWNASLKWNMFRKYKWQMHMNVVCVIYWFSWNRLGMANV